MSKTFEDRKRELEELKKQKEDRNKKFSLERVKGTVLLTRHLPNGKISLKNTGGMIPCHDRSDKSAKAKFIM